jgi:hypothetical protein
MIEIYASRLSEEGKETYKVRKRQSLAEWLYRHGIDRKTDLTQLAVSLYLNGDLVLPWQWRATEFGATDQVEIYREPKSGFEIIGTSFLAVFAAKAVLGLLTPKLPSINGSSSLTGKGLDQASSKGNKVKINDVRPEMFGYNPQRYPDYLAPPRRYFAGPREQRVEMVLGVGVGSYNIELGTVKTGETPLLTLGTDATFSIYAPGADLSADPAHYFWYSAPEVGASSTGASGLELTVESTLTGSATASVFTFNSDVVGIPTGAGSFPADWVAGTLLNIAAPYAYTVADGTGSGGRDVISGPIAQHNFIVGDTIQIAGDNQGFYVVHAVTSTTLELDYEGGAPGTGLVIGSVVMAMSYRGMRFRVLSWAAQSLQVKRIKSGGTDDNSWPGWDSTSSNVGQVLLDSSNLEGGYRGPFPACPAGELVTAIEVDIFYPSGLVFLDAKGTYFPLTGYQSFEYRDMAVGGAWTASTVTATANSLDARGYTYRVDLPYAMRPEVRMKKIFVNQGSGDPEKEQQDTMMWYGLKGLMLSSSPSSYSDMTVMTCDIRGGDRISAQSESLVNLECTRILPVLRAGAWQAPEPTREISAAVGHIIRSVGYSDTTDIDLVELDRLESTRWTPRGDTYDRIVTDVKTVKSNLLDVLQAGSAELTIDRGLLVPVRDEPRGAAFDHVYNPQVMLDPLSYDFAMPDQPDDFDGVDVEYYDHATRQNETVECRLPGDAGERVEKLKIEGVGVRFRAWRIGMRQRRSHLYRRREYNFKTELDALNSAYFDYVALGVATPGYGQSAEVVGYTVGPPVTLESSEPLDWSVPGVYKVLVRRKDGTASGPYVATRVDDYSFTIPTLDFVPDLSGMIDTPPIIQFGHESKWCFPALITDVSPSGTRTCSVKAVNYDERMYLDDDAFPP